MMIRSKLPNNVFSIISFSDKGYLFMILTSLRLNFLFDSLTFPFFLGIGGILKIQRKCSLFCVCRLRD